MNNRDITHTSASTTLDRLTPPAFFSIKPFKLMEPQSARYANGLNAFYFHSGEQDLVRIEWIFENDYQHADDTLIASCIPPMLLEGTKNRSNAEIMEFVDFHGAYLVPEFTPDYATITLFSLTKHLAQLLPLVKELLTDASFPERELSTYLRNRGQRLEISLQKNDVVARRLFNQALFGDTRYGRMSQPSDLNDVKATQLEAYYRTNIRPDLCTLVVAGNINQLVTDQLEDLFGQQWSGNSSRDEATSSEAKRVHPPDFPKTRGELHLTTKNDALQSAIRLGFRTIQRSHTDFPGLQFLNAALGGYFGSRLMANIREDKGYTYGIGSGVVTLKHGAYLTIATEVGVDVTKAALDEIAYEIQVLKDQPIPSEEMELVRNYLMGTLLGSLENVFSHADHFKQVYFSGLNLDYYDFYQQSILNMDSATVQRLANEYLNFEDMEKVVVGKL